MFLTQGLIQVIFLYPVLQVNRVLKVLEKPYSDEFGLEPLDGSNANEVTVAYDMKPPVWAQKICIT